MAKQEITVTVKLPWYTKPLLWTGMGFLYAGAWFFRLAGICLNVGPIEPLEK